MNPKFITFEGCEGSGKSTQAKLLKEHLEKLSHKVILTREPGGTELAEEIRKVILSGNKIEDTLTEFLLISAARRDHVLNKIKPALADGNFVICDRFFDSSLAYQGFARGLDLELMQSVKNLTIDGFQPDITFLIDIEPSLALERIQKFRSDNNHYDAMGINFHNSVRNGFLELAEQNPNRICVVDGNKSQEEVFETIINNL
jgi:dTMP kinase